MFDSILQFVKEIFIIGIISEIFTALSDTKKYRNQISFITGLMITTVCLKGVFNIINIDYSNKQSNHFDQIGLFSQELELKEFNIAENFRLLYVAITRAKRRLYITVSQKSKYFNKMQDNDISIIFENLLG